MTVDVSIPTGVRVVTPMTPFTKAPPAAIPVRFAPLIAGNAPVKFAAGKLVKDAPDPLNVVAVHTPVANTSPSGLSVSHEPIITSPELLTLTFSLVSFA